MHCDLYSNRFYDQRGRSGMRGHSTRQDAGEVNDVAALAWFLLSSLVPLALGVTAVSAVLLGDYGRAQALATRIFDVLPRTLATRSFR